MLYTVHMLTYPLCHTSIPISVYSIFDCCRSTVWSIDRTNKQSLEKRSCHWNIAVSNEQMMIILDCRMFSREIDACNNKIPANMSKCVLFMANFKKNMILITKSSIQFFNEFNRANRYCFGFVEVFKHFSLKQNIMGIGVICDVICTIYNDSWVYRPYQTIKNGLTNVGTTWQWTNHNVNGLERIGTCGLFN